MEESGFPQFNRLPHELQILIWEHFVAFTPSRVLSLRIHASEDDMYYYLSEDAIGFYETSFFASPAVPVPVPLQVCVQSRIAAEKRWQLSLKTPGNPAIMRADLENDTLLLGAVEGVEGEAYLSLLLQGFFKAVEPEERARVRKVIIISDALQYVCLKPESDDQAEIDRGVAISDVFARFLGRELSGLKVLGVGWDGEDLEKWKAGLDEWLLDDLDAYERFGTEKGWVIEFVNLGKGTTL